MNKLRALLLSMTAVVLMAMPSVAFAQAVQSFVVDLDPLNNSGVDGAASLTLRGNQLTVQIRATGLVPNQTHPQHIHGLAGTMNATCPTAAMAGADGVLSLEEGLPAYGPVLLPLDPFPSGSPVSFQQTYTIDVNNLQPLQNRVIVLHGAMVAEQYVASLPVACGEIRAGGAAALPATGSGSAAASAAVWVMPGLVLAGATFLTAGAYALRRRRS